MTRPHAAVATACIGMVLAWPAHGQDFGNRNADGPCRIEIAQGASVQWRGIRGRGYEIYDRARTFEIFEIPLRHTGAACRFHVTLSPQGGSATLTGGAGGDPLQYDVVSTPDGRSLLSQSYAGNETSILSGEMNAGTWETTLQLYLAIPPGQLVRAGEYRGGAMIRLFQSSNGGLATPVSEAIVSFYAAVPAQVRARLDGQSGGASLSMNFGDLRQSPVRSVELELSSNAQVGVSLSSVNNGRLMHESGRVGVPYSVTLSNTPLPLSGTTRLPMATGRSGQEIAIPLTVAVGPVTGTLVAGRYNDTLTVTITAQ